MKHNYHSSMTILLAMASQAIVGPTGDLTAVAGLAHLKCKQWITHASKMFNHKNL